MCSAAQPVLKLRFVIPYCRVVILDCTSKFMVTWGHTGKRLQSCTTWFLGSRQFELLVSVSTSQSRGSLKTFKASVLSQTDWQTPQSWNRGSWSWYRSQTVRPRAHPFLGHFVPRHTPDRRSIHVKQQRLGQIQLTLRHGMAARLRSGSTVLSPVR